MSQERTRFPIQPKERRRSAKSGKDTRQAPEGLRPQPNRRAKGNQDQDKPNRPPHRRHEEDPES
jgi:hypothetical protein